MTEYIYQQPDWPDFTWNHEKLAPLLAQLHLSQGLLLGRMEALGFDLQLAATLATITLDVLKSSEIEGEILNPEQVRSSIARRLGIDTGGLIYSNRNVEGVVEMMMDATQRFEEPLSDERLFSWHAALFPTGRNTIYQINVGQWRDDKFGPMQVVSGPIGKETVHFEAPHANQVNVEMKLFLNWFNQESLIDPFVKAGIAHFWFVTIHPFDDGNGRIARAITDLQLARSDQSKRRFYSLSTEIQKNRKEYYKILENTSKGNLDITAWLEWFLHCLEQAFLTTTTTLNSILKKHHFFQTYPIDTFNERQKVMVEKLHDDFFGKLTTSKWAKITGCSQDSALRDIQDLIQRGILVKEPTSGRNTSYILAE